MANPKAKSSTESGNSQTDVLRSLSALTQQRENVFALANAIYKNSKHLTADLAKSFQAQIHHLEKLESQFATIQDAIIELNFKLEDSSKAVETTKVSLSFYEILWSTRANAQKFDVQPSVEQTATASPASSSIPLLPIQIPKFDGTGSAWTEFKALFDQLVHQNSALSDIHKFYYLKTFVVGEAAKVIANLDISDNNYSIAYAALTKRYASKRRLANRYMCDILQFRQSGREKEFLSVHENAVNSLKAMHLPDLADYVLFRICYENLSPKMKYLFDDRCNSQNVPSCKELFDFILHHTQNSELRLDSQGSSYGPSKFENKTPSGPSKTTVRFDTRNSSIPKCHSPNSFFTRLNENSSSKKTNSSISCPMCKGHHLIYSCADFLKLRITERREIIKTLERCFNCLGQHHIKNCRSKHTCSKCNQKHHSFLHLDADHKKSEEPHPPSTPRCHFLNAETSSIVILGTFMAQIEDHKGEYHSVRCVMDPGSHISAVTKQLADKLGLKSRKVECSVSGLANSTSTTNEMLEVSLRSCVENQTQFRFPAYVFPKICQELPSQNIVPNSAMEHIQNLQLADPFYGIPGPIDLLLSAEMSAAILSEKMPNLIIGQPTAIRTAFGWVLYGSVPMVSNNSKFNKQTLFALRDHLDKFWAVEEVPTQYFTSPEDEFCELHFQRTHTRDNTGRYIVSLPFRTDCSPLGSNRDHAMKRWLHMEKKLSTSVDNKDAYNTVLQEYVDKNHMEIAPKPSNYILPHHAVFKVSSTTKLRVVFDASTKDSAGLSLNDRLLTGPKLQKDIASIISSFRSVRFALCGDISQMYRMIWLHPSDRSYQHIFWRKTLNSDILEYELRTLTFGLAPAPFLAQRVLHQLVLDEGSNYDLASRAIEQHTYIDDIITGVDSIEEGKTLQNQLIELLAKGGFHLRKWSSNSPELLQNVPPEDLETPLEFHDGSQGLKVLGLFWDPHLDIFTYQVKPFLGKITKRTILSFVARIYDPMGWLAPVIIVAKCFLQRLWLLKLDWDTEVPNPLREEWITFSSHFDKLCYVRIPRQLNLDPGKNFHHYRLVGFCDASEVAYAACVYLQNLSVENKPLMLLQAKTKVAPLKSMTIPCLELCGALLLVRLVQSMVHPFPIQEIIYFTDSEIVLTWLQTPLYKLKIFVGNRVAQILEKSQMTQWHHISGSQNPADLASRGLEPKNLSECPHWWNGPKMIPAENKFSSIPDAELPELKPIHKGKSFILSSTGDFPQIFEKFSSWSRLQRIIAWVLRFNYNCRFPNHKITSNWLTAQEHQSAEQRIILLTQRHHFSSEIQDLQNKETPRSLLALDPFLDEHGYLRVGGRLRHSQLHFGSKHPLLLPKSSHVTRLIIQYFHETSLHSGPSTVQALIQQKYWIPSSRNLIRKQTFQCIVCHRLRASVLEPKMGDLPTERVTISRPFSCVATDFAGPFLIKESTRRNASLRKCYLCVFVCMATKAVHLEAVTSLTTEAFLSTFTRFVSRRGLPTTVWSDNGRNFVGASRELKEIQRWLKNNENQIGASLATKSITWKFNPPEAPHFGGLFEAAIKSAKSLLVRVAGKQPLTLEEISTLFSRIEAILNSRPLIRVSADPGEDYIAPSHFLVGGSLHEVPEKPLDDLSLTTRWKRVQQLNQVFWKRWSTQYLQQLIPRTRWQRNCPTIKIGDLVYLKGQSTSPLTWPLGKIIEIFPGKDGIVRVASVRTSSGIYIRPTNKLIPLPGLT